MESNLAGRCTTKPIEALKSKPEVVTKFLSTLNFQCWVELFFNTELHLHTV